jgi:hypothetical protein
MSKATKLTAMSASARREKVVAKVREAMALIEREIEESQGVYVGGRLSLNEVCRKAGVHPITMQGSAHRSTTKPMVLAWMGKLKASTDAGNEENARMNQRIKDLEAEVLRLQAVVSEGRVVQMPKKKR